MLLSAAAIQLCSSDNLDENLSLIKNHVKNAAKNGAKLVVLPEMFPMIGKNPKDVLSIKEKIGSGKIQTTLSVLAQENKLWIVAGTIPIACEYSEKIYAACLVYDDKGNVVARYDKIHLFDAVISATESYRESDTTQAGSHATVIDTPLGKLGIAVCFDLRFPDLFLQMRKLGAQIIAVPSAFTMRTGQAHWELLVRCRAIDTFCYVIGAAQGGVHASGRKTYGHSMIVNPWGTILSSLDTNDAGIIMADIDLAAQKAIRQSLPVYNE